MLILSTFRAHARSRLEIVLGRGKLASREMMRARNGKHARDAGWAKP